MKATDVMSVLFWNGYNIPHAQLGTLYLFLVTYTRYAHRIFTGGMGLTLRSSLSLSLSLSIYIYIYMCVCV